MDVSSWLRNLGLENYVQAFQANHIDAEVLPRLTADDLTSLGITSVGHRRRLLDAIAALQSGTAAVTLPPSQAERRQLTVLLCDLLGSTELSARLDPEDMRAVITAYQNACAGVIGRFEGHVAKYMGDGVLAYFGWPRAHEDDAERAVRAGLAVTGAVSELKAPLDTCLTARVGIATGQVVVGDLVGEGAAQEEAVVGETPNLAARLQALAEPGSVVISQATRRLVGGLFELTDLGLRRLKGFAEPLNAWRVEGEGRAEGRFEALHGQYLTPLVGREHELGILLERWAWSKDGEGQVVLLSGEPGIGKSRVIRALREHLGNEAYTPLSHYCSPYHTNSALYPVIGLLERAARLDRDDPPEAQLARLEAVLARASNELDEVVPLIAALLGVPTSDRYPALTLTPEMQKRQTLQALVDQLAGLAAQQPVLALYEDVHWIDPSTLELLGLVIERIQRLPVLVLITFRPEFQPPWIGRAHVTTLTLSRLGRRQGADLVARVTGEKPMPAEIVKQIVARTDGVPLFVEELTKTVLESGLLTDAGETWALSAPLPRLAIPATLHDSLMARLDRLAPVKEIAQTGAVIGREFSQELLAAVVRVPEGQLADALDQLVASELVFRRGTAADASYAFKHALIQDAAYQSLLKTKRKEVHARIAAVLEDRFLQTTATEPELLAHHFTEAGLSGPAVDYWSNAGGRALERSAYAEAMAHLARGLELLDHLPAGAQRDRRELKLLTRRAQALRATRGYSAPETGEAFARARQLCRQLGDITDIFPVLHGVWAFHLIRAEYRVALNPAQECLSLAERGGDSAATILAHRLIGQTSFMRGELAAGRYHLEQALALYDPRHHAGSALIYGLDSKTAALTWLSQLLWVMGYPDRAWRVAQDGLADAGPQGAFDLVHAMFQVCVMRVFRREFQAARKLADDAVASANKHALSQWALYAQLTRDWARLEHEGRSDAIAQFAHDLSAIRATGNEMRVPIWLGAQAAALAGVDRFGDALETIREALALTEDSEEHWSEAELQRLEGEILLMQDGRNAASKAASCFLKAIEVARSQEAKSWELRAATSLARLWAHQRKRVQARDLLAPIYEWFTEGFDTADLKDAKALLDELA